LSSPAKKGDDDAEPTIASVQTRLHIDHEICVRRVQSTQTNVTRALATYT
jgi:hypothetical protein